MKRNKMLIDKIQRKKKSKEEIKKLKEIKTENKIKFHLKLNTGMNRLGVSLKKDVINNMCWNKKNQKEFFDSLTKDDLLILIAD